MLSGVRADSFTHLQLGPGALLTGLDLDAAEDAAALRGQIAERLRSGEGVLGATRGGGSLAVKPRLRYAEADGLRQPTAAAAFLDGWTVTLSGTLLELTAENLALLLPGCRCRRTAGRTELQLGDALAPAHFTRLCWVGTTAQGLAAAELRQALSTGGLNLRFAARGEGTLPFTFTAHGDVDGPSPLRLVLLTETSESE